MRLWSLHPKYLDARALVALWREALLAQAVLRGKTKGYARHPQLHRFRERASPVGSIAEYLRVVHHEAETRGFRFAVDKISRSRGNERLTVSRGQLLFEWRHLRQKLRARDPKRCGELATRSIPEPHPLFRVVPGAVAQWERGAARTGAPKRVRRKPRRSARGYADAAVAGGYYRQDAMEVWNTP